MGKRLSVTFLVLTITGILFAQNVFEGKVSFDRTIHDFGDILVSDGPQRCTFTLTNVSSEAVVINRVVSSCGCTEPTWSKQPLRPGEKGKIDVTYKNDSGPYPFDKSITTYITGLSKPIVLKIKGNVHDHKKSVGELYPFKCGPISFREQTPDIGQVEQGFSRHEEFEVANTSGHPVSLVFSDLTPGLGLSLEPEILPQGGKGKLICSINTAETTSKMWGRTVFSAKVCEKGNMSVNGTFTVKTLIRENVSTLTDSQKSAGALIKFPDTSVSFGTLKKGEKKTFTFDFTNEGRSPLVIYKIDSSEPGAKFSFPQQTGTGEKGQVTVNLDTSVCPKGEMLYILTVMSNSPLRPIATVFLTGNIL